MVELHDVCQSCTYWRQHKGSFGYCDGNPKKIYDGSKKGTSCINWRQKQGLRQESKQTIIEKPSNIPSLRNVYNKTFRPTFKATHATNIDGEFVTFTSDIHTKNGYYRHRYNYTIIDMALTLFLNGKTYVEISKYLKNNNMRAPSRRAFREWVIRLLGKNAMLEHPYYKKFYISSETPIKPKKRSNTIKWYHSKIEWTRKYMREYKRNRYRKVWNGKKYVYILRNDQPLRKYVKSGKYSKKLKQYV